MTRGCRWHLQSKCQWQVRPPRLRPGWRALKPGWWFPLPRRLCRLGKRRHWGHRRDMGVLGGSPGRQASSASRAHAPRPLTLPPSAVGRREGRRPRKPNETNTPESAGTQGTACLPVRLRELFRPMLRPGAPGLPSRTAQPWAALSSSEPRPHSRARPHAVHFPACLAQLACDHPRPAATHPVSPSGTTISTLHVGSTCAVTCCRSSAGTSPWGLEAAGSWASVPSSGPSTFPCT